MDMNSWKKVENESGYPYYIDEVTGKESYDHPHFRKIMKSLESYEDIKYSAYRIAFKIYALQKSLKVPPLRICAGVFGRHQLSLSESSLSLDTVELEAVLADIYFAAAKEGLFDGDVDLTVDLLINLLLNIYDSERKSPIRVLAAKTLLILLSEEPINNKWQALANCGADHNGCVSPKRLAALLVHVTALPKYLGCKCDQLQTDVDSCFEKSAGMLGVSTQCVAEWGVHGCASTRWLALLHRVQHSRSSKENPVLCVLCGECGLPIAQMLKFKCSKCDVFLCENCYLYDKELSNLVGHKKTHVVHEIIDGEVKPIECLSFMKNVKRFFFCTKTKKKKTCRKNKSNDKQTDKKTNKPAMFTSTVGKASGNNANNPASTLQDIITQLENQNKALKELSQQLQALSKDSDGALKEKVDAHYNQVSTQISRLKTLKDNILNNVENIPQNTKSDKERPQAFDLFSPIPVDDKQSKVTESNQPRVLSMDSGNFSVVSKPDNLLTVSGDALKPVVVHASDTIATVSMNDMSNWYHDSETTKQNKSRMDVTNQSISATEQKFLADFRSVQNSNDKVRELNADLDTVLDRLQQILTHNFTIDESCFDNTQLRETASEMEGLLGTLIRGVEQRATLNA
ncbi:dystrophin-like [Aricia agestis]|uniref:dystrophin-like n=1 Tax=Aricia agestis TaxID=91739 RepID=UPI001C206005|nr:dystrophin-like [Aricia agestis]